MSGQISEAGGANIASRRRLGGYAAAAAMYGVASASSSSVPLTISMLAAGTLPAHHLSLPLCLSLCSSSSSSSSSAGVQSTGRRPAGSICTPRTCRRLGGGGGGGDAIASFVLM